MKSVLKGKKILVTGGTGFFGKLLVKEILKYEPSVLRIYSRDETEQFNMRHELIKHSKTLRFLIGDIREKERLKFAMADIDIVYHLAALKHVESCEYNAFEALKTNAIGTQNVIEATLEEGVQRVIFTSTDKAVNPSSTMGTSKLLAEKLIIASNFYIGKARPVYSIVRLGNIIGSRGSAITLFREQIKNGGPVTVTDKAMTRYILLAEDALKIIFKATRIANGGEIFIPKMSVVRLSDIVEVMLADAGKEIYRKNRIGIKSIGTLPGEKSYEELMTEEESARAFQTDDMYLIIPSANPTGIEYAYPGEHLQKIDVREYSSKGEKPLVEESVKGLLSKVNVL